MRLSTTQSPTTAPACSLSLKELAARRHELIPGPFARAEKVSDIPGGLRFQFAADPKLLPDLARVIGQEQDCCSFLRFQLTAEPSAGGIILDVTGSAGTGEVLRKPEAGGVPPAHRADHQAADLQAILDDEHVQKM